MQGCLCYDQGHGAAALLHRIIAARWKWQARRGQPKVNGAAKPLAAPPDTASALLISAPRPATLLQQKQTTLHFQAQ